MRKILILLVFGIAFSYSCHTKLVGVFFSENGTNGTLANLTVSVVSGSGRVFVNTMPLVDVDTQISARIAKEVACNILNTDCSHYDFYYNIDSGDILVSGPSAGASMAVCTMAALLGVDVNKSVVMTGLINPDGTIGPVGAVSEKGSILKNYLFLVPKYTNSSHTKVGNVFEAFKYFTGIDLRINASFSSKDYELLMDKMDQLLINYSKAYLQGNKSKELLDEAIKYRENKSYYTSASYCVRSLLYSFENYNISKEKLQKEILDFKKQFTSNYVLNHPYDLELYLITMSRIQEAQELLNDSLPFAKARLITAKVWAKAMDYFNTSTKMDLLLNKDIVLNEIYKAKTMIGYAEYLIGKDYLASAEEHIEKSEEYLNKNLPYSLFEALRAKAVAMLLLEATTNSTSDIEYVTKLKIKKEILNGNLPILGISFLEYSHAFDDLYEKKTFLIYSYVFSDVNKIIRPQLNEAFVIFIVSLLGIIIGFLITLIHKS